MKKSILMFSAVAILAAGCYGREDTEAKAKSSSVASLQWPSGIAAVPDIPYTGSGKIIYATPSEDYPDSEFKIGISGATLKSANDYLDGLRAAGWKKMHMCRDWSDRLEKPTKGSMTKLGLDSADGSRKVMVSFHFSPKEGKPDLVLVFADTSD